MTSNAAYQRRKDEEVCLRCGKDRDREGRVVCKSCAELQCERQRLYRAKIKAEGKPKKRRRRRGGNYHMAPVTQHECGTQQVRCACGVIFCPKCAGLGKQCSFCVEGDARYKAIARTLSSGMSQRRELRPARSLYSRGGGACE